MRKLFGIFHEEVLQPWGGFYGDGLAKYRKEFSIGSRGRDRIFDIDVELNDLIVYILFEFVHLQGPFQNRNASRT